MDFNTQFTSRYEAIERAIVPSLGEYAGEFDVEAIAAECVDLIPGTRMWTVTVDADTFWEIAARHDLTEETA